VRQTLDLFRAIAERKANAASPFRIFFVLSHVGIS
jgi:hypothetical protein